MEELIKASQSMATRLYQQASEQATAEQTDGDEEVVEAEIVEEGDEG